MTADAAPERVPTVFDYQSARKAKRLRRELRIVVGQLDSIADHIEDLINDTAAPTASTTPAANTNT